MKKRLLLALISILLIPNSVSADGGVFLDFHQQVYLPEQKAAIFWDGTEETLILSTKIRSESLTNMAWVIPLPSKTKPEIEKGDISLFYELAKIFEEKKGTESSSQLPAIVIVPSALCLIGFVATIILYFARKRRAFLYASIIFLAASFVSFVFLWAWMGALTFTFMGDEGVEPIEIKKVDIYDVATLKATNATALVRWLNDNGYTVPESAIPILQDYCNKENFYFIANKINLEDKYKTTAERNSILYELEQGIATPLEITFQPDEPFYPQKISSINDGTTDISVYVISPSPVEDKSGILSVYDTRSAGRLGARYKNYHVTLLEYHGDLKTLQADSIFPTEEIPFWMQWWFWAMVAAGIVALVGAVYFLKKRKPPTPEEEQATLIKWQ
jgi:hypothetical protein